MAKTSRVNAFWVLKVNRKSTPEEISAAYRHLAVLYHPDKGGSAEQFARINEAYKLLTTHRVTYERQNAMVEVLCMRCDGEGVRLLTTKNFKSQYITCEHCSGSGRRFSEAVGSKNGT